MIIFKTNEKPELNLRQDIKGNITEARKAEILLNYPVVYVHAWKDNSWHLYVGETYDIVRRTKEHYKCEKKYEEDDDPWQAEMKKRFPGDEKKGPFLLVFGNEHFNRSMTLDLEHTLITELGKITGIKLHNGRHNEQGLYDNCNERNGFFYTIWKELDNCFGLGQPIPKLSEKNPLDCNNISVPLMYCYNWKKDEPKKESDRLYENRLKEAAEKDLKDPEKSLILKNPVVYIHIFRDEKTSEKPLVYVGEANKLIDRTKEHLESEENDWHSKWKQIIKNEGVAVSLVIGHPAFNKSMTLDIENRLINYFILQGISCNGRTNEQNEYNNKSSMMDVLSKIIGALNQSNKRFPTVEELQKKLVFMASPLMKLTEDNEIAKGQESARKEVLEKIKDGLGDQDDKHTFILIKGGAGTGKTVLLANLFFTLYQEEYKCNFVVNNDELAKLYKQQSVAWQLCAKHTEQIVMKAEEFINKAEQGESVDVLFVDEAHLLMTQGNQRIREEQVSRIRNCAKVTVLVFDPLQFYDTRSYWDENMINKLEKGADITINLELQLRMGCNPQTVKWIKSLCNEGKITSLPVIGIGNKRRGNKRGLDNKEYEIWLCDNPEEMVDAINEHRKDSLAAILATFDQPYEVESTKDGKTTIPQYFTPSFLGAWNITGSGDFRREGDAGNNIVSVHDIQGFDLDYAGLIIGESIGFENGRIKFYPEKHQARTKNRTVNEEKRFVANELIGHELYILLTRAIKGLYIYACDEGLRQALQNSMEME